MKAWKFLFVLGIVACNEIKDCQLDTSRDYAVVAFYNASDSTAKRVKFNRVYNDASPYLFYDENDSAVALALFLNPEDTAVTYSFITDSIAFSLQMRYDHRFYVYSPDCPPTFSYKNLEVLDTNFDSVSLISPLFTKDFPLNLEIYF